jgi:hypothetical protein
MPLPNPGQDAVPFTTLTAQFYDETIENIESLADGTGFDSAAIPGSALSNESGYVEIARQTLGSAGDTITLSSIPARKYLKFEIYLLATGGTMIPLVRLNNDSGANYARRVSANGGADATAVSGTDILNIAATGSEQYMVGTILNVATNEKQLYAIITDRGISGAADVPNRSERLGKWVNTSDQINRIDVINNGGTGDFAIGSEIIVYGHN